LLSILEARSALVRRAIGCVGEIDQRERTCPRAESFDFDLHPAATPGLDAANPADQIPGLVPAFNRQSIAPRSQGKRIPADRERVFAGLHQHGPAARFEKLFNR
jgi:hypothetical protein